MLGPPQLEGCKGWPLPVLAHHLPRLRQDRTFRSLLWLLLFGDAQDEVGNRTIVVEAYAVDFVYLRLDFTHEFGRFVQELAD